jgi:hypothetical protein
MGGLLKKGTAYIRIYLFFSFDIFKVNQMSLYDNLFWFIHYIYKYNEMASMLHLVPPSVALYTRSKFE